MIGISLGQCVASIAQGEVEYDEVEKIISSTRASTLEDQEELFASYRYRYWAKFPDRAEQIARQLFTEGKVEQPRLHDDDHHPVAEDLEKIWVNSIDEIVWWRDFHAKHPTIQRAFF